jgi:hypothetical protein
VGDIPDSELGLIWHPCRSATTNCVAHLQALKIISDTSQAEILRHKLLQVKRLELLVDEAFYLMFKCKNALVLLECRLYGPEEGGSKLLRNVSDYRSTHRSFREEFDLHHTAVRFSNPLQPRALRRHAITSFGAMDPWQVSDPTASRSGHFMPGKSFPSKHSAMSSIQLGLSCQDRLIN